MKEVCNSSSVIAIPFPLPQEVEFINALYSPKFVNRSLNIDSYKWISTNMLQGFEPVVFVESVNVKSK